jgi:limonene-1,2-epoxide hydrolase
MSPTEIVTQFIHAIERRDLDAALALVTDDVEYDNVPIAKVFGPDGIRSVLEPFSARYDEIDWVIHRQAEQGDVVFNERTDRFRTGERWIELPVCGVFELRDDRICLWRDYFDDASFRRSVQGA